MAVLVIKLGALGDFVLAWRAMTAIRAHHPDERLVLLTIPAQRPLAEACGLFDEVWYDRRPRLWQAGGWLALARRLNRGSFRRVYDLQANDRTGFYFRLMGPPFTRRRPEWSGIARGCSHPHANPARTRMHTLERHADQLVHAGIDPADYPPVDTSWVRADVSRHGLAADGRPYVLMVPGSAPAHGVKRWPAEAYAELARRLVARGVRPVVLGMESEADACARVAAAAPEVLDLCGDSPMLEVMALARDAAGAVGNDTGPMHLIAVMGCPSLVLFSRATDPAMTRPRGPYEGPGALAPPPGRSAETVAVLREDDLADLAVDRVEAALPLARGAPGTA